MAKAQTAILLENTADVPQQIYIDGERYTIPEHGMAEFTGEVAVAFLEQRGRWVREFEPVELPPAGPGERMVWIANVTGNPFVDKEVTERRISRGREEFIQVPNPIAEPRVIRYTKQGGQIIQQCPKDPQSEESINLPPTQIVIPPYRRLRMGSVLAEWLITRDIGQPEHWVGSIQYARGPAEFEPNVAWSLNDLRLYAEAIDHRTFIRDHPVFGDVMGPEEDELGSDEAIRDATQTLWRKLFFRLIDERFGILSEYDWRNWRKRRIEKIEWDKKKAGHAAKKANRITEQLEGAAT